MEYAKQLSRKADILQEMGKYADPALYEVPIIFRIH